MTSSFSKTKVFFRFLFKLKISKRYPGFSLRNEVAGGFIKQQGYLPFTWENRKFQLENQMVRGIPFGKLQKIWAVI